ncbi:MAG TPA: AsmA family protein, partial [Geminicoccaceae bacterium]|nr:AsmA family protein [Geminicoccaceae bacterium]
VRDPKSLAGITLAFDLASENPRQLLALAGRPVDQALPPLTASARLTRPEEVFRLEELRADWGESRVEGELSYDPRPERPTLTGELRAPKLDLVPVWPALTGGAPEPPSGGNPLAALSGYDGDVRLATGEVRLPQLTLRETEAHARLGPGGLTVDPLRVAMPEGRIVGRVATGPVDQQPLTAEVALNADGINLAQAVPGDAGVTGVVNGELTGTIRGTGLDTILNESQLRFEGRAEGVQLPSVQIEEVVATARLEGGRLMVDPFRATLPEGRVAGQVTAGPFGEGFTADAALDIEEVDLAELVPGDDDGIAGVLTAKLDAKLRGSTAAELLAQSVVQLDGQVDGLTLPQLGERVPSATLDASLQPERERPLRVVAEGQVGGTPLRLTATGGAAANLAQGEGQYPLTLEAALGNTTATANGSVALPIDEGRFNADILVEGPDPAPVLALFELPEMELPPYRIEGEVTGRGTTYRLGDLDARVGDSRMSGDLTLALDGPRPKVSGELRAPVLDADDFGGLVGSQPGTGGGETASAAQEQEAAEEAQDEDVIPQERIEPSRWQKIDLDLRLSADEVRAGPVPFDSFEVAVLLEDGLLRLEPLVLRAGEGRVEGQVRLDAGQAPVTANVDLNIRRLPVGRMLERAGVDFTSLGELSGRARGDVGVGGTGMGVQEILGNSDGEVTVLMQGGSIDRTLVAALGFDLLRLFGSVVDITSERVELRCTLADLAIRDGIVNTRSLVIDTPIADIGGDGTINLETEEIDITLLARPDETPLPTDRTGISITGTLAEPEINVNPAALAIRGAAAATLGVLLKPFTALAGVVGDDENTEAPCGELLEQSAAESGG